MPGMINIIDYNNTVTASGNSDNLDTSGMGQLSFTAELTAVSGSGVHFQVELQASDDTVNWNTVHTTRRMITTDVQRISGIRISSKWYRYVWIIGGSSPSANLKITTTLKDFSPTRTGSMFRYDDLDLKTVGAISSTFSTFSNTEAGVMIVRGSDLCTEAVIKIQGSQDGSNWHDHTGDFSISAGQSINKDFSGISHRFLRIIVVTAATGSGSATSHCLWNSTGGA